MNNKKQILDPLSCLCKLGMLTYYNKGTKISIINNMIHIQELDKIQWIKRTYNGDGKDDISILYNPIIKSIEWYVLNDKLCNDSDNLNELDNLDKIDHINDINEKTHIRYINNIISHAIIGLDRLQETYGDGNVILAIKFLKNNLKMSLRNDFSIEEFVKFNEIKAENNGINYSKIKQIWKIDKIRLVSNQFDLLDKHLNDNSDIECLLKSLKSQLMDTDLKFQEIVKSINSVL
jgi:hypothetical protein